MNAQFNFILLFLVFIFVVAAILMYVLYLLNLQRLLNEISPTNRLVPPVNVWLMFIPLFNIIYPFILYPKICDSVRNEYQSRGRNKVGDYGKSLGITMAVIGVVGPVLNLSAAVPTLSAFITIANLVLLIIFWVKMANYKNELKSIPTSYDGINSNPDLLD